MADCGDGTLPPGQRSQFQTPTVKQSNCDRTCSPGDVVAVGGQASNKAKGADEDDPDGRLHGLRQRAGQVHILDGSQRPRHVANLARAVRKDHCGAGVMVGSDLEGRARF